MNCKPGDRAFIVQDARPFADVGKVVHVKRLDDPDDKGPCWLCDSESGPLLYWNEDNQPRWDLHDLSIPDAWLRPIRPDGITDSEVSELFSPSPAKESEKV